MAITFPAPTTYIADLLRVPKRTFTLAQQQEFSGLGSGQILAAELAPALWTADIETKPMPRPLANQLQARLDTLDGTLNAFYLYDPWKCAPSADPGGTILGSSTPSIHTLDANNKAMRVMGLPAAYVLTEGDYIAFDYASGTKRAFHRIVETATADGSGLTPLFEVRPHIRSGATTSTAVTMIKPAALMVMMPGSLNISAQAGLTVFSFTAIQRLT